MKIIAKNKKARFDYEIIDKIDAGIVLLGHEVKAIKTQSCMIKDAIVKFTDRELRLINMDIPVYQKASPDILSAYEPKGRRKLLITNTQRTRLRSRIQKTGLVVLPLLVYEHKNRKIKIQIGLGKRKKKIEKRSVIQDRQTKREMDREIRRVNR